MKINYSILLISLLILLSCNRNSDKYIYKPVIASGWWEITGNPDLGEYSSEKQEPVDFGVWQAADGTWQIWSCIRKTKCGGNTRLFYGWEAKNLTDTMWKPQGIMMEADTTLGEVFGGLQAPHVIKKDDWFYMLYGGWAQICLAKSKDGKNFDRVINEKGTTALFSGPFINTRDAMTIQIKNKYYCYYTGHLMEFKPGEIRAAIFCRTSENLMDWDEPVMVSGGGKFAEMDSWGGGDAECPFVVQIENKYILFRNIEYGRNNLNVQYNSDNPYYFGVNNDSLYMGQLKVAAPEIVKLGDEYFIFSLKESLDGIKAAKLKFEKIKTEL